MLAEVAERFGDERCGGRRDEDLTAMPTCSDASSAMDVRSDVAFVVNPRRPGVDAYTDADRQFPQSFLGLARCRERAGRGLEGIEEGVALRVNLYPP